MCIFQLCDNDAYDVTMMAGIHILVLLKRKMGNQLEQSGVVLATWNPQSYTSPLGGQSELRHETPRRKECQWYGLVGSSQLGDLLGMAAG